MKRTPENLPYHELIGLMVQIVRSKNPTLNGLRGNIVDETKNTIKVEVGGSIKTIPKKECRFSFFLPDDVAVELEGSALIGRPEDRIGRWRRR